MFRKPSESTQIPRLMKQRFRHSGTGRSLDPTVACCLSVVLDALGGHCPAFLLGGTSGTFIEICPSYMPQVRDHGHLDPAGAHSFLHRCLG